ncbi:MAG: penicillin-binding protein 2 [Chloroflexi bacterium]|nr:MAG: penicillin-binding protein 2 [Chloroflexota bacterium]
MKPEGFHTRIYMVLAIISAAGLVLMAQLVRWQVLEHQRMQDLAEREHRDEQVIPPRRGEIYDRNGHLLAGDIVEYDLSASPKIVTAPQETAQKLSELLDMPRVELLRKFSTHSEYVPIATRISQSVAQEIQSWENVGLKLEQRTRRVYPEGELAGHVLGFVNSTGDGFYGVEGYYNNLLRGKPGLEEGERSPFGDIIPLGIGRYVPPKPGGTLYLTIDRAVQYMVEEEIKQAVWRYGAQRGSVIVMNPRSGAILAMANYPSYDPNAYSRVQDDKIFFDPNVSEQYEPGSVFKIVTMAAGLDAGVVTPQSVVYDGGYIEVGGRLFYNWDRQGHGSVDMTTVLAKSLNVGVAQVAVGLGKERFYTYVKRLGFGRLTEIDLGSEGPGTLKTPQDASWYASDLAANSFGQGIAVTPIQMAVAVAAIANDGLMVKPHVVERIVNGDEVIEVQPTVVRRAVSEATAHTLTNMLVTALEQSDSQAVVPGYRTAGKTGTAEIPVPGGYHPTLTIASFVGYLPADDPQVLVLVILDRPTTSRWGSKTAAPTFRRIAEQLVVMLDIPPDEVRVALKDSKVTE